MADPIGNILTATQANGRVFKMGGGPWAIKLKNHAGGTWVLQVRTPGETDADWVDTDVDFTDNGIKFYNSSNEFEYRMSGGSLGATAECADARNKWDL